MDGEITDAQMSAGVHAYSHYSSAQHSRICQRGVGEKPCSCILKNANSRAANVLQCRCCYWLLCTQHILIRRTCGTQYLAVPFAPHFPRVLWTMCRCAAALMTCCTTPRVKISRRVSRRRLAQHFRSCTLCETIFSRTVSPLDHDLLANSSETTTTAAAKVVECLCNVCSASEHYQRYCLNKHSQSYKLA